MDVGFLKWRYILIIAIVVMYDGGLVKSGFLPNIEQS